jgi:hypothetical protein
MGQQRSNTGGLHRVNFDTGSAERAEIQFPLPHRVVGVSAHVDISDLPRKQFVPEESELLPWGSVSTES